MLSLNNLRIIISSYHGLQHSNRILTNRQCLSKAASYATQGKCIVTFCRDDMRHSSTNLRPLPTRGVTYQTNNVHLFRTFCTGRVKLNCWNCKQSLEETPTFFCMSCKAVQPPDDRVSYFQIMDCKETFTLDTLKLQKRYLQLQRSLHPDNFTQKTVMEQEHSANHSALVNRAYKTLQKPLSRGLYMLELKGLLIEEGTDSAADPQFLMDLMEINEAVVEARTQEEASEIGQATRVKLQELTELIDAALQKGELQAAKALLAQMKYFANIEEKVKEKLSELM